jgi:hypothetical protein
LKQEKILAAASADIIFKESVGKDQGGFNRGKLNIKVTYVVCYIFQTSNSSSLSDYQ